MKIPNLANLQFNNNRNIAKISNLVRSNHWLTIREMAGERNLSFYVFQLILLKVWICI